MSTALYGHGGLRFWSEDEIEFRESFQRLIVLAVRDVLVSVNPAWTFARVETPILCPRDMIAPEYSEDEIFVTNHKDFCLRAETTPGTYVAAKALGRKLPLCVWQSGRSFRRETNDGASAAKLRFNEFNQLEFQCIYSNTTKADYRAALIEKIVPIIGRFTARDLRVVPSDRLPSYSQSTLDIECKLDNDKWRELASCSIRTDYAPETLVAEIAIGLDRVVSV